MSSFISEPANRSTSYLEKVSDFESKLKFDPITYQHSLNVASLSLQLAKQSPYNLDDVTIYYAGLFHDIGKTIMPISILKKEKQLSRDEFLQIKEHARQGFRILQKYKFPSDILFGALLHHEKYDGSGYPIGFIGKEIPIIARIINICDVFDALTSDRPYRLAYSVEEALHIMENTREQFDPELIQVFFTKCQK
ncbi:MAG: HD domain-containing protein [Clostridia bacterium]|nr:HD domain-containing protein [Clostridia bacterium]